MNEDTGTCMTPEQAMRAENEELKAICRDKPDHSDLDAAAFQVNILMAALSRAEARIAELEATLRDARYLLESHAIAAALKGDADADA